MRKPLPLIQTSILLLALSAPFTHAQARGPASRPAWVPQGYDDHQNMMDQLNIKSLRPGKNGNKPTGKGFDDATGNDMMSSLPDVLKMNDGTKVTTADQWPKRRAEILEDFEREVYGRIPATTPKVTWEIVSTTNGTQNGIPTITKLLTGHVDNSTFPQITVNIRASFTIPANATGQLPIMIEFSPVAGPGAGRGRGFGGARGGPPTSPPSQPAEPGPTGLSFAAAPVNNPQGVGGPDGPVTGSVQNAIQYGWAYGAIDPNSIQADAGGNAMRQGIIGLCNKGEPRKPDDWGALRAWQWGVSQLIEYFANNPDAHVDATKLGIEGVSRYGKAALVTEAFEPRVAVAFVASSGEGGAKLSRHDVGEAVENLTGGEYYWMAGNFIKYGAADINGKPMTAVDLPVDAHELIALCAPRPCFLSAGIPNIRIRPGIGDPLWIDAHGCYMAGVLATPVYELFNEKGFGNPSLFHTDPQKFYTDPMPPLSTQVGGKLAWREHEGGHTAAPNFPAFYKWITQLIQSPMPPPTPPTPAGQP